MKFAIHALLASLLLATATPLLAADCAPQAGAKTFANKCAMCHVTAAGAPPTVGPNLHGVVGRAIGKEAGFAYSEALTATDGPWSEARLDQFLTAPQQAFPGTAMPFAGLKSPAERQQLLCYLNSLN